MEVVDASENSNMQPKPQEKKAAGPEPTFVSRDGYWSKKEEEDKLRSKEIRYEACLKRAIAMVDLLITSGALTLGANAKKKVEIIDTTVEMYTRKFYTEATEAREGSYDDPSSDNENNSVEEEVSYE